ncbi:MAG TPA: TlpA disulfide reductase family protein [Polyangia bacterium]|nr:TlpA disulfide reductase family protein [Polyangia bacterium]
MTTRLALALSVGAALASGCGRGFSPRVDDPAGPAAEPPRAGAALAAQRPAAAPPPAPGPGYTVLDLAAINREVRGRGRPVLLHFWASWCGPCLEELPLVDKFARDAKARGVDVVSLSLDDPQRAGARVVEVLSARAPNLTRHIAKLADSDAFINAIDPRWEGSIPAIFAFDKRGRLRDRLIGEASRRELDTLAGKAAGN